MSSVPSPTPAASLPAEPVPADLRHNWQLPLLIVAAGLLAAGVVTSVMSRPKPEFGALLGEVEALLGHEEFRPALDLLNDKLRPYVTADMTPEQRQRFHVLRARAIHLGQHGEGADREENHRNIAAEYALAESHGARLEARDVLYLGETLIALGEHAKARARADALPAGEHEIKERLLRGLVEAQIASPAASLNDVLALLDDLYAQPELGVSSRAWAQARRAELLLRRGYPEAAVGLLLRSMPGLVDADPTQLGELYLLLARAYRDCGALADAGRQAGMALTLLAPNDPGHGEALVVMGMVEEQERDLAEARERYARVLSEFGETPLAIPALLGLAQVDAALRDVDGSVEEYAALVDRLAHGPAHPDVTPELVARSLMNRYEERLVDRDTGGAIRYATLAARLFPPDEPPPEIRIALARAHRQAADDLLAPVGTGASRATELASLDPSAREGARRHLTAAGAAFRDYAHDIVDSDNAGYADALWMAADSFDLAGEHEEAIKLLREYAEGFAQDPRQGEARFRLAQAYEALGDYPMAAQEYRSLIDEAQGEGAPSVGPYADESLVPLARTYLADGDDTNDSEAEGLLRRVVDGQVGGPRSRNFRNGLVELARLHYRKGEHARAIERLEEALARFPNDEARDELRYGLADSYRQDAERIGLTLRQVMPDHEQRELESTRAQRLGRALELFDQVRQALEARDPATLTELERTHLRNSHFYLGDCAYALGDFDAAIRQYDAARERYHDDPASLVAMIQIVNAYLEQDDVARAATANERARRFYEKLPPEAWADPNLPITQADWERWLASISDLIRLRSGAAGAGVEVGSADGGGSN